jgi:hypothetical protein
MENIVYIGTMLLACEGAVLIPTLNLKFSLYTWVLAHNLTDIISYKSIYSNSNTIITSIKSSPPKFINVLLLSSPPELVSLSSRVKHLHPIKLHPSRNDLQVLEVPAKQTPNTSLTLTPAKMSYYFTILSPTDTPIFNIAFGTSKGGGDGIARFRFPDTAQYMNQFIIHSSLDILEEAQWTNGGMCAPPPFPLPPSPLPSPPRPTLTLAGI